MNLNKYKAFLNKIIVFYKPDSADYWNSITKCSIEQKPQTPGRYYLDFSSKIDYPDRIDENGIPVYKHRNFNEFYHPIVICQYAFALFEKLFRSDFKDGNLKKHFLLQADWLSNNFIEVNNSIGWQVKYDIDEWNIKSPWFSAMAQGEAISVLIRAYFLTNNNSYIKLAERASQLFNLPVSRGGVVNFFNQCPVYEEYPSPVKTVGVLNGFIFSLFGLYDLWLANKNKDAKSLFEKGIASLKKLLPFYDTGYWSQYYLYDYPKYYPASYTYHQLVIEQLKVLYILTDEKIFDDFLKKWNSYSNNFVKKNRALLTKLFGARILK